MREVLLTVHGCHKEKEGEWEGIEVTTTGSLYDKNNSLFLLYDEVMGEDEADISHNRVKIEQNPLQISITRTGAIANCMTFSEGYVEQSTFGTPFGNMVMEIRTKEVRFDQNEEGFHIYIVYDLVMDYDYASSSKIQIDGKFI